MNQDRKPIFDIQREAVSINGVSFSSPPTRLEFVALFSDVIPREYNQGIAYLPALIFDEIGIVLRYRKDTEKVALVDLFFASSQKPDEPKFPFSGTVYLNGKSLQRPVPLGAVRRTGDFAFDDKPIPAAQGKHGGQIGVSIKPKFEFVGVLNVGWSSD